MNEAFLITGLIGAVLFGTAFFLLLPSMRRAVANQRTEKALSGLGHKQLESITLDDGMDGRVYIDRLLLTDEGFLVIERNWRGGHIFGGDTIDTWAQVVGKQTSRFNNPMYALEHAIAAVKFHSPGVAVSGRAVFLGECSFPKGKPESVLVLEDIAAMSAVRPHAVPGKPAQQGWERIVAASETINEKAFITREAGRYRGRLFLGLLTVALALAWLTWRLLAME